MFALHDIVMPGISSSYARGRISWEALQLRLEYLSYDLLGGGLIHWIGEHALQFHTDRWYTGCGLSPLSRIQRLWGFYTGKRLEALLNGRPTL